MKRPVQFLLRYHGERLFLRWDCVTPSLGEFLGELAARYPHLSCRSEIETDTCDARKLSLQPEAERQAKIRLLLNMGLGILVLPLLTRDGGMTVKEATEYMKAYLG